MNVFTNIIDFFKYLSLVDIVFLVATIVLIVLVVTLIYFIKINKNEFNEKKQIIVENTNGDLTNKIEEIVPNPVEEYNDEEAPLMDLESLTKKLKEEKDNDRVNFTEYEKDQEEKAIISYDELLKRKNNYAINYEKEEMVDDILVKKVNLSDLVNKDETDNIVVENVRVISYQKEEAFLNALKELNKLLN